MVRNESVIFGRHIDIELATRSYSWKYQNWFQFCTIWLAFKRGCLEVVLSKNTLSPLGVNMTEWGFQMFYYGVLQSYYGDSFRLGSLVAQNCIA
jgi:hypothetical protein